MRIVILLMAVAGCAAAQQTWGGLRFGMKPSEVQTAVAGAKPVASDPAVHVLEAPVAVREHPGTARLIFEGDALARVGLVFEMARGKACASITPDEIVAADRLQKDLRAALEEKYGQPVSSDRRSTLWKDAGQTIRYSTTGACAGSVFVSILYEPVAGKDRI